MNYTFYILTTDGIKTSTLNMSIDLTGAPFGVVPYRQTGSCELEDGNINIFWNAIDQILTQTNTLSGDFIRAIRAVAPDGTIYGEVFK